MTRWTCLFLVTWILILVTAPTVAQAAADIRGARVAVWDPGQSTTSSRFVVNADYLDQVASWLREAGAEVTRLTTDQVDDDAVFSAERFDAFMLEGGAVPTANLDDMERFTSSGGVLVALAAENPFEVKIARRDDGSWRLDPENPKFAWQTKQLHDHFGLQFNWQMEMAYSGVKHTPTSLLKEYLPEAEPFTRPLLNRWFRPTSGTMYPLVRSQQTDGTDYTPQLYLAENQGRRAIISASRIWTGQAGEDVWPHGRETVVALAGLARDLRSGAVDLSQQLAVVPPEKVVVPGILAFRAPSEQEVDPEGMEPVIRWGRFDGALHELGEGVAAGGSRTVTADAGASAFPKSIDEGGRVTLALPDLPAAPLFVRVRGAVDRSEAVLRLAVGDEVIWNETLVYRTSDAGLNLGIRYEGSPWEFHRIIYLPPTARGGELVLSNPGKAPIFFDAVQIERRSQPAPTVELGMHTGVDLAYDKQTSLTREMLEDLSILRATSRPWWIGPPEDPNRWVKFDQHVERYFALHDRVQLILEGTPRWAAIDPNRYAEGGNRKHMTPPDNAKFAEMVRRIVSRYADQVADWEIWNEANIRHFWQGSPDEYADLYWAAAPLIREYDPTARLIIAGMAGTTDGAVDPFAEAVVRRGVTEHADLFGMHVYAGAGLWDVPYGLIQGHLLSLGSPIEIYANEQGYIWRGGQTFHAQHESSPEAQARLTDIGMARLMASGAAKVTNFNVGGDANDRGLIDEHGKPRPAWAIMEDYLQLVRKPARRLDVAMTGPDGGVVNGVYVAAAQHEDGSTTLVINPAESPAVQQRPSPSSDLDATERGNWKAFWGGATWGDGRVTISPHAERDYCGFFRRLTLDPTEYPEVEVVVPEASGEWALQLKWDGGEVIEAFREEGPGTFRARYVDRMKDLSARECEISFRVYGASTQLTLDAVRFPEQPKTEGSEVPRVVVKLPLPDAAPWKASAVADGNPAPVQLRVDQHRGQSLATLTIQAAARTVVQIEPVNR